MQSIKIPEEAHCKLLALAEYSRTSKSGLASELLIAALDDALEALPLEPSDVRAWDSEDGRAPETVRDYVRWRARQLYHGFLREHDEAGLPPDE
jgi:hypothetical protein